MQVINQVRHALPQPLPAAGIRGGGPLRSHPPTEEHTDPAPQRWYWRQGQRREQIAQAHTLAQQGLSVRAIARQTGHHRQTIKHWLAQPIPPLPADMPAELTATAALPAPRQRQLQKAQQRRQGHRLAQEGLSHTAIARAVGLHREALQEHRFLLLRRPEQLQPEEQAHIAALLASPVGAPLQLARTFLLDWYRLWTDEAGQRRPCTEAQGRYEAWRTNPTYQTIPPLRRVQAQMTPAKFERLSQFLRHPQWEATNNGVERAGRAFRHRQAPHFNLRSVHAIENAITVAAFQQKAATLTPVLSQANGSTRGRKPRCVAA